MTSVGVATLDLPSVEDLATEQGIAIATLSDPDPDPVPSPCNNCVPGTIMSKTKNVYDSGCWNINAHKPFLEIIYSCRRYNCDSGRYYWKKGSEAPGTVPTDCGETESSFTPECPGANCGPIPPG
jgi:hypothetical protein